MTNTPKTNRYEGRGDDYPQQKVVPVQVSRNFEWAGNALHERLEHWISMNSGVCDPKDVEAIENWKKATQ